MKKTSAGETARYKWTNGQDAKKIEADLLVTFKNPSATTNQLLTTIKQNLIGGHPDVQNPEMVLFRIFLFRTKVRMLNFISSQ